MGMMFSSTFSSLFKSGLEPTFSVSCHAENIRRNAISQVEQLLVVTCIWLHYHVMTGRTLLTLWK
ncbi:hypothetical protein KC19_8G024700 [Ceratodon purpureus]|uniref:Uncharacterized protein n=1 Tax=Ceratodon purpureus TaxID=3225 RepID=A0A8T0GWT2_CERPU|nr:hypothetical protein KC19_8G024700 [Ceratodon purpureus]